MALSLLIFLGLIARAQSPDADDYEPNNTKDTATPLLVAFDQQAVTINIVSVNCHVASDVDIYKIELPAGFSYLFRAEIYDKNNRYWNNINYTLDAKASYSTDGVAWSRTLPIVIVPAGTLYLKIEPNSSGDVGTYFAKINLNKSTTAIGCTYTLSATSKDVSAEAGDNQQVAVETGATCFWAAVSNANWIRLTAGQSGTGSRNVSYSYDENDTPYSRTGIITVAGQAYTVTQAALSVDRYELNNAKDQATLLTATYTQNATTSIDISSVNCHVVGDVDIYKINFAANYTYTVSAVLYDWLNPNNNSKHWLNAKMSYSINNNNDEWIPVNGYRLSSMATPPGGTLYLKIEPRSSDNWHGAGTYAAKIEVTPNCNCFLPVLYRSVLSDAGIGEVAVARTASACTDAWTAVSNATWITVTSGASATGSGDVGYSYTQNTSLSSRRGTITIGGQTYAVTQAGRPDGYEPNNTVAQANSLTPVFAQNESDVLIASANFHRADDVDIYKINLGADSYTVNALFRDVQSVQGVVSPKISYSIDGLAWTEFNQRSNPTVRGSALYIKIAPSSQEKYMGSYAAKINIKVSTTPDCTYTLSATSKRATSQAGADQISVTTTGSCAWTAVSNDRWITLTSGQSGTGSGSVGYYYTENTPPFTSSPSERTGTITIGNQTYTMTQAPAPRFSPDKYEPNNTVSQATLFTPTFTGNAGDVDISSANCHVPGDVDYYKIELGTGAAPYTISGRLYKQGPDRANNRFYGKILYSTDNIVWMTPSGGSGNLFQLTSQGGTFYLKVEPLYPNFGERNLGHYAMKVEITRGCTYSLDATSKEAPATLGSYQVGVTASGSSSCPYRAVSDAWWISIISGDYATGSGRVTYSCDENTTTSSRTGILLIAGHTYTVTQSAGQPLSPDKYEPNNTVEQASLLTPTVAQNTTSVSISSVNCHDAEDVDFYKINLGTDYYTHITGHFYCRITNRNNHNYNLPYVKIYYSTDADLSNWTEWNERYELFQSLSVQGRTLYLKIEQMRGDYFGKIGGAYAVELEIIEGCTYSLWAEKKQLTSAAGSDQISVIATSSNSSPCPWTATSNAPWITLASGQQTGSGNVSYSYTENNTTSSRTATITVAGQTYRVTQSPPPLSPDGYEPNNIVAEARLLPIPPFTQNASSLTISPANCHQVGDIDIYKIDLPVGNSYQVSGVLYDWNNPNGNSRYTLDAKISYSTDGIAWSEPQDSQLPSLTMSGGTLYLRIEPYVHYRLVNSYDFYDFDAFEERVGSYAAKINILKTTADCTYSLLAARETLTATDAGSHQVRVEAGSLCAWAATSHTTWITLASNQITTGAGSVGYSCRENPSSYPREGTITIANQTYTVVQAGGSLSPDGYEPNNTVATASPLSPVFTQNASALTISSVNCHEAGDVDIYKIALASGYSYVFNAVLHSAFPPNNGSSYTLDASIAYSTDGVVWSKKNIEFKQIPTRAGTLYLKVQPNRAGFVGTYEARIDIKSACAYSLAASSVEVVGNSSTATVEVTAGASCPWNASSDADWITVNPAQGTGTATVSYTVARNTGAERTGTITIAGQTLTVKQAVAPTCSFTLPSTPMVVSPAAGTGKVSVTASATDCPWTATSNVPWITIPEGQTLAGTKDLDFSYEANSTNAPREGTITIAGETFTVKQSSLSFSSPSVTGFETASPVKIFPNPAKDFVTIEVSSSNQEWTSLKITNMFGQALYERTNPEHKMQIPLTGFSSGLYFIVLQGKEKTAVQKLIIE